MYTIVRARLRPMGSATEYISVQNRIKAMLLKFDNDNYDFVIDDNGRKSVKSFGVDNINPDLVGKEIPIVNDNLVAKFNDDGTIEVKVIEKTSEGALPRQSTVDQLKKIRRISKKTDIGDKISNAGNISSPIDKGIESYEKFQKKNKKFITSWNLKHLKSPFKDK